jgi:hypothetical protein
VVKMIQRKKQSQGQVSCKKRGSVVGGGRGSVSSSSGNERGGCFGGVYL